LGKWKCFSGEKEIGEKYRNTIPLFRSGRKMYDGCREPCGRAGESGPMGQHLGGGFGCRRGKLHANDGRETTTCKRRAKRKEGDKGPSQLEGWVGPDDQKERG